MLQGVFSGISARSKLSLLLNEIISLLPIFSTPTQLVSFNVCLIFKASASVSISPMSEPKPIPSFSIISRISLSDAELLLFISIFQTYCCNIIIISTEAITPKTIPE